MFHFSKQVLIEFRNIIIIIIIYNYYYSTMDLTYDPRNYGGLLDEVRPADSNNAIAPHTRARSHVGWLPVRTTTPPHPTSLHPPCGETPVSTNGSSQQQRRGVWEEDEEEKEEEEDVEEEEGVELWHLVPTVCSDWRVQWDAHDG